jgi:hypothetical protein
MMFKQAMTELILAGKKTQTRRMLSNKRVYKIGSIQPIQINYFDKAKHHIKIIRTYTQRLSDMTAEEVKAEGFNNWPEYMAYLDQINKDTITPDMTVRVYEFKLLKEGICSFPETYSCPDCASQKVCVEGLKHPCDVEFNDP